MKKRVLLLPLIMAAAVLLSGCSLLYNESVGNNIGPFVDPVNNGADDFIPEMNAEKTAPYQAEDSVGDEGDGAIVYFDDRVRYNNPALDGDFYVGDGFQFYVPQRWRDAMAVEVSPVVDEDYDLINYDFIYVAADGSEAKMLQLRAVPYDYYSSHGRSAGTAVGEVTRGETVYLLQPPDELPENFSDIDGWLEVYGVLSDSERLQFSRTEGEAE